MKLWDQWQETLGNDGGANREVGEVETARLSASATANSTSKKSTLSFFSVLTPIRRGVRSGAEAQVELDLGLSNLRDRISLEDNELSCLTADL